MARTPQASPGAGDDTSAVQEATFFSADVVKEETVRRAAAAPRAKTAAATADTPLGPDSDPALTKRVAGDARASAQQHADDLGEALHAKFMQLLGDRVRETSGHLTEADVAELGDEFRAALADIKTAFLQAVETYTLARDKSSIDHARRNVFQRMMVRKFENRFTDEKTLQQQPELLSRRMLPGFFAMVSIMFGTAKLADYETRTNDAIDKLRRDRGGKLDWADVHRCPEVARITLRADVEIAENFRDVDKRLDWMVAVVNSNMIPPETQLAGPPWSFNTEAATGLLTALFRDLRAALRNDSARKRFIERMGGDMVGNLDNVVRRFG